MPDFGLNQVTISNVPFDAFVEAAARLGCVGVEARNDLGRPLFDGMDAGRAGDAIKASGLRLLGLSQVYPFNCWSDEIAAETQALIDTALESFSPDLYALQRPEDGSKASMNFISSQMRRKAA